MNRFAQNYPQLMNQAMDAGYSRHQLTELGQAFRFALDFTDGVYRAQGVPLINHVTSTASIVMAEKQEPELVMIALLHAAYVIHLFDDSTRSHNLVSRRQEIRTRFGHTVEDLLYRYGTMEWYEISKIRKYLDEIDRLEPETRALLTIRLANELDDHLDDAMDFAAEKRGARTRPEFLALCRDLARALQLDTIADELDRLTTRNTRTFDALRWPHGQGFELRTRPWEMPLTEKIWRKLSYLARNTGRKVRGAG